MCADLGFEGGRPGLPAAVAAVMARPGSSSAVMGESMETVLTNRRQLCRFEPKRLRTRISALFRSTTDDWLILAGCPLELQCADWRICVPHRGP